ncbi:hypothetical protein [Bradyrhizobium elkanii]|uniref:Uncharacterized protein n=1 Tax=Bradyrhizobium elkanii TaxID=29448 RepID=A0ABV4F0P5_BRAEL|nr:hypothetical protein [Bradyrhizobium elkanii]MCP1758027.1 hypothetical protein [Bradyrhizobium elkanii]MCP1983344.1 hypothetical protein [Bradyrhizobium elkanii]MCS3881676.1 hypothetical protein [Bradyrhizobium elkanii]MCS4218434.1 hypothetical protein [Bradyrhizobium elkanii]MCW2194298.1 hypothetical protein [Bradyrhizobium elkanii]
MAEVHQDEDKVPLSGTEHASLVARAGRGLGAGEVRFQYSRQDLLKSLADRRGVNLTTLMRSLADAALAAEGFAVAEQQYALVHAGELMLSREGHAITTFRPFPDERGEWLPIENEDTQPFDPAQHWRLKPLPLRVDGERVVRTYPVVAKSQEHA